jgi:hypothetical protein
MSEIGDLETAVLGRLAALDHGGRPVFAELAGHSGPLATRAAAAIRRHRTPAGLMVYTGRGVPVGTASVGMLEFSVLLHVRHCGGDRAVRWGDGAWMGSFELLDRVTETLNRAVVLVNRRLRLRGERLVLAEDGSVVYEQHYRVEPFGTPIVEPQSVPGTNE